MKDILKEIRYTYRHYILWLYIRFPWISDAFAFFAILLLAFSLILFTSCKTVRYVPIESDTKVVYRDSLIEKIDTQYIQVPHEVDKSLALPTETLSLETSYAIAYAWLDNDFKALRGEIRNKDVKVPVEVVEKERIVYRDSTVYQDRPVEVVKTKYKFHWLTWLTLGFWGATLLWLGYKIFGKR